jgi:hypothetical protein
MRSVVLERAYHYTSYGLMLQDRKEGEGRRGGLVEREKTKSGSKDSYDVRRWRVASLEESEGVRRSGEWVGEEVFSRLLDVPHHQHVEVPVIIAANPD